MEHDEYVQGIGEFTVNLQGLELLLRVAIIDLGSKKWPPVDPDTLRVGAVVPETPFTDYDPLGKLIERYNAQVEPAFQLDKGPIVALRDALAHGRVLGNFDAGQPLPMRLFKFGRPGPHGVVVEAIFDLTEQGLKAHRSLLYEALRRVGMKLQILQPDDLGTP